MLGVHFSPVGDGTTHAEAMRGKGMDWVDKMKTKPLPTRDAWLSLFIQLLPAMYFGLATVIMSPAKLDDRMQSLYYHCLPFLGVNRNITKPWRMLPEKYHGLGLPNFVVVCFATKVFLLQRHWGFNSAAGNML